MDVARAWRLPDRMRLGGRHCDRLLEQALMEVLNKSHTTTVVVIDEVELEDWGIRGLPVEECRRQMKGKGS